MQNVNVKRDEILEILQKNREAHIAEYKEAVKGFRTQVIEIMTTRLAEVKDGGKIELHIGLNEPIDMLDDYNKMLRMLEMSVDDEITLTNHEFDQYVMDNFDGREFAKMSNTMYFSKK